MTYGYAFFTMWLLVAVGCFCFQMYLKTRQKKQQTTKEKNFFRQKRLFKVLLKIPVSQCLEKYLKEAGYPYGIVPESYLLLHGVGVLTVMFPVIIKGAVSEAMIVLTATLVPINLLIYYKYRQQRERLQVELCNIQDIIYFQSKIGTPQDVILAYAAKAARDPLKMPLQMLAEKYKMSRDLSKALEQFRKTTNLMEFQAFTFILEQKEKTGFSEDNHYAQATMLKRAKRMRRRIRRAYKRTKLIVASVLLFGCYTMFATVPLLKSLFQSLDLIFR